MNQQQSNLGYVPFHFRSLIESVAEEVDCSPVQEKLAFCQLESPAKPPLLLIDGTERDATDAANLLKYSGSHVLVVQPTDSSTKLLDALDSLPTLHRTSSSKPVKRTAGQALSPEELWQAVLEKSWQKAIAEIEEKLALFVENVELKGYVARIRHIRGGYIYLVDSRVNDAPSPPEGKESDPAHIYRTTPPEFSIDLLERLLHKQLDLRPEIEKVRALRDSEPRDILNELQRRGWKIELSDLEKLLTSESSPPSPPPLDHVSQEPVKTPETEQTEPKPQGDEEPFGQRNKSAARDDWNRFLDLVREIDLVEIETHEPQASHATITHNSLTSITLLSWNSQELLEHCTQLRGENSPFLVVCPNSTPVSAVVDSLALSHLDNLIQKNGKPLFFSEIYISLDQAGFDLEPTQIRRLLAGSKHRFDQNGEGAYFSALSPENNDLLENTPEEELGSLEPQASDAEIISKAQHKATEERRAKLDIDPGSLGSEVLGELVGLFFEVIRADEKVLGEELEAMKQFFESQLELTEADQLLVEQLIESEAREHSQVRRSPDHLVKLPEPIRDLVVRATFEVAMADLEYHPKEKAVLADIAERLKVSPDILKFLEIENSEETSLFDSKLATLGLEEPVRQVDLDAAYARLSHRYEPSYFGKFSSVFEDLAKKYRAMIEDRYDQLSKNLESHLASKATIFDKPLADIISSDRIYRLIRGRGIRTIGELLSQPLEVVKNIDGLGASSWSKLENNLLNFSRRNSALLAAVESFLEQTPAHKAESPFDISVRKLLSSRFMIDSLEGAGMKTVRDILSTPHLSIRSLEGFDKQHWGELCRSLGDVGRTYSEAWPLIEDYFQGVLLHSGVNEVIAEPASELSEQEFQGVLSTVLEVVREKTSVPLWKIEDGLKDRGIVLAEEALAEALAAASRSGALFCLTKDRFGSPEALRIDSQRSEQLRDRALEYLAVHESINCFSSAWREGFTDLSADQVDFCLGMDTRFTRGEDEHYRLTQLEQSSPANKTDKELPSQEQQLAVQVKTLEDRVHERLENQGRFLRYEDLLEDTSLKDVVQALSENDRFLTAKCFRDYFGLSDWGIDEMTRAVNADWGILKLKLLRMTPGEAAELSELAAHSLISVCEQKELLKPLRVLNQKWSVACSDPTLANALKLLQESKKPTIITQLVRQIGLDRRDQANFIARAKEDVRFAVYPFASEKYIGLSDWGASAVGKVAEDCWPWVRMELKDATPEEGPDYTAEQWDAVRAVAEKMGEPELLPESQGLPPLEVDTSKTVTSPLEEEEEAESELYESTNETVAYIDRNDGLEILKDILSRANKQSKPFSIAELRVTEQEFKNLADWALELSPARVDSWVEDGSSFGHPKVSGWSWSEAFGFFLIVLWSEAARRRSVEGNLWKHIPGVFSEKTRRKIFAGNTPRAVAVDAFELAAKKAGVRHVFGLEGTQAIYITTFLQFGITRKGLKRLPAWLSEGANMPRAVELLCDDGMNPFSRVWRELRAFRKGHKKRSEIRQLLQDSPFFPNDWVEEILQYAKSEKKSATREVDDAADLLDDITSFVTGPFLSWPPGGEPSLLYRVHPENGTLNDYGYDILVNETVVGRLTKQPDGSFQAEPDQLSVNLDSEFATIACVGDDTDEEIRTTLPTLSREDDWEFFDGESGVRKALDALATANSVVVCLPEDEDTQGAIEEFVLADPGRKLARYSSYAAVAQMAGQEADEEWDYTYETDEELDISSIRAEHHASATTRVRIGEPFEVFVTGVPRGASVNWARIEGRSVDCVPQNTGHTLITDLDASFAKTSVRIELSIRFAGRSHRVERRVALDFLGATMLEAGSWTACHNLVELRAKEAAERAFRFCVPRDGHSDWGLVEGEVFTERPVKGITSVKNLSGYGAPLWLRKGPYNSKGAGLCLAESVVDRGWLRGFGIYGDVFTFWLNRTIQPDPDYALHLWSPGDKLHTLGFEDLQSPCLGQWKGLLPDGIDSSNYAFAMSFRGERLGGWWSKDFWIPEAVEAPTLTAQLIRWFHLPILSDSFLDEIKKFAHTYPEAALEAWLTLDEVGEFGLTQPSDGPQWLSAMRRIFLSAPSEVTNRAWRALISSRTTRAAFELILKVDPLLAVIMVLSSTTPLGHHLPSLILGSDILEGEREERARATELLRQAATETRSHPTFVQRTAEDIVSSLGRKKITALQRQNLSILCNRPAFRRYLAFIFYLDKRGT